jgi:hypothetical protein
MQSQDQGCVPHHLVRLKDGLGVMGITDNKSIGESIYSYVLYTGCIDVKGQTQKTRR